MKEEKPNLFDLRDLNPQNKTGEQKALYWYQNPIENVRMLRTMIHQDLGTETFDATPHYPQDPKDLKVGVVIGTYGSVPYIDLNIWYLKNINHIEYILIHDDCSDEDEQLRELCKKYNDETCHISFYKTPQKMFYRQSIGSLGDQSAVVVGLNWAKQNNLDILVKISRRLVPCFNWIDDFKKLVIESDGITFSAPCKKDLFPIRTELIGFNVHAWTDSKIYTVMYNYIQMELCIYAEYWYGWISKMLDHQNFSQKYRLYEKNHHHGFNYSGYVHWTDILGNTRYSLEGRHEGVLWHMYNNKEEYLAKLYEVGLTQYKLEDL